MFGSDRAAPGIPNLYWVNADGTGEVARLHEGPASELPLSWHPSGKFLTYTQGAAGGTADTMILPMDGDGVRGWSPGKPVVFLNTPATESYAMFSPDGRWIAYTLSEPGKTGEVYVRPFPGHGGPWRISTQSGVQPEWSPSGHELLYLEPTTNTIKYVSYTVAGDSFRANTPQVWQPTAFRRFGRGRSFGLHPDGKRVALIGAQGAGVGGTVTLVFNFFTAPAGARDRAIRRIASRGPARTRHRGAQHCTHGPRCLDQVATSSRQVRAARAWLSFM